MRKTDGKLVEAMDFEALFMHVGSKWGDLPILFETQLSKGFTW